MTKVDTFPLPRIDDLLDQLGGSKHYSTLDLASGFWQIRVRPDSREKTAFVTPQGLLQCPRSIKRLMQQVIMGLNAAESPDFVSVYIDNVFVFLRTLREHLEHQCLVIQCMAEATS